MGDTTDDTKDTGKAGDSTDAKDTTNAKDTGGTDTTKTDDKANDDTANLKKALSAERKAREEAEKRIRDAELAKLPELERAKAELSEVVKERDALKTENMRLNVGMKNGLPWNLAKRITGATLEEMEADATELLKDFKRDNDTNTKTKPPTNDGKKGGTDASTGKRDMNALLRAAAGRG